ncbi:MAG: hypothetical protein ACJAYZ_001565 [Bacteroidia bacterium]|jgi:hypothetical protein
MKNITIIILSIVSLAAMFGTTGCGADPVTKPAADTTDTDTVVTRTVFNQMKVGLELYDLNLSDEESFAVYNATSNTTLLFVKGNDPVNGDADFNLEFTGNMADTFTTHNDGGLTFACGTGTIGDIKRQEYSADNTALTAIVTEYGAVGAKVKGTFSGVVKIGTNSVNISEGKFNVVRISDE